MADLINQWKNGLAKSSKATFGRISTFLGATEIDNDAWDDLEATLFQSDMGLKTTSIVIENLKSQVNAQGITKANELTRLLKQELLTILQKTKYETPIIQGPRVIMMVGVNGSGKTTTIGKIGAMAKSSGKSVLFGAGDTFRAAAYEQLAVWGERSGIDVIHGDPGSDAGAVAYNTIQTGIAKKLDLIIIDTAGRLHTRFNLMEELKKVYRVIGKALPAAPHEVFMVLDATTGQNAIVQAKNFKESVNVSAVILTKLDSSAKGGMVFSIISELNLPIAYVGLGEKQEDLLPFDPEKFVESLIEFERGKN